MYWSLPGFVILSLPLFLFSYFSVISISHFIMLNSISLSWSYILIVYIGFIIFGKYLPHILYGLLYFLWASHIRANWLYFPWSSSDRKSLQVFRTILAILSSLINAVVWMVLARPSISSSSSPLNKPSKSFPSTPNSIDITITLIFHNSFRFLVRLKYWSLFWFSLIFTLRSVGTA